MIARLFASCLILVVTSSSLFSQRSVDRCGTMENLEFLKLQDQELEKTMEDLLRMANEWVAINGYSKSEQVVSIPVVVHIVYNTSAQNLADSRVFSQIAVLNEDFQRLNADSTNTHAAFKQFAANTKISFCLAQRDPGGFLTTGITRTQTSVTSFSTDNKVKYSAQGGKDAWDRNRYLNLWVANLGSGLLGYAQFPGGPAASDGVVIASGAFGRPGTTTNYNLGRTATHEVGHWLGLKHIWGDATCGNDNIPDTPIQQSSNFGCPTYPRRPNSCSVSNPNGDMFMNFMDYVNDNCMNMFTHGQDSTMNVIVTTTRPLIKTSLGCFPGISSVNDNELFNKNILVYPNPANSVIYLKTGFSKPENIKVELSDLTGRLIIQSDFSSMMSDQVELNVNNIPQGLYHIKISTAEFIAFRKIFIKD